MSTNKDLHSQVTIITGACAGMGNATAKKLAKKGSNLVLLDLNRKMLEKVKSELKAFGVDILTFSADVSSEKELKEVAQKISEKFAKIDNIINFAGISLREERGVVSGENFDKLIAVNLKSVYLTTMIFGYPLMKNGGSIVNISSIRARTGTPSFSSGYAASKAGVSNLTKSFALELSSKNIRVNCISPGATYPTKMSKNWSEELRKEIANSIPLKRLGSPEDMANVVYFLVSDLSTYVTGQTIDVNGGAWMS